MHIINNLPVILAAFFTLITGLYGYTTGLSNVTIYKNMCVFLIVFYFIGFVTKSALMRFMAEFAARAEKTPVEEELLYQGFTPQIDENAEDGDAAPDEVAAEDEYVAQADDPDAEYGGADAQTEEGYGAQPGQEGQEEPVEGWDGEYGVTDAFEEGLYGNDTGEENASGQ